MKKLLLPLLFVLCSQIHASPLPDFPFVTVTGESEINVKPDQAIITFTVESYSETSEQANSDLNQAVINAVNVILASGVSKDDITSYEVSKVNIRQDTDGYQDTQILGYEHSQTVQFTLNDLGKYPELIQALLNSELVIGIEGEFDLADRTEVEKQLIMKAAKEARSKAQLMTAGLGVELGPVYAINDSGSFNSFFATFGLDMEKFSVSGARLRRPTPTMFIPKTIKISKNINVVYQLEK